MHARNGLLYSDMHRLVLVLVSVSLTVLVACSDMGDPAPPVKPVVPTDVKFGRDVQAIFNARCAIPACHVQPLPKAFCNLTEDSSYANLVNVPTKVFSPGVRVTPFDLNNSVLYLLVRGGQMPASGSHLTTVQIQTIRKWIEDGAPNN
jgi:hypothetical protein